MAPIHDELIDRHKYILMYDDERVLDALAALRDAGGQDWWYLIVDLQGGGYAATQYGTLASGIRAGGPSFLARSLGTLVGDELERIECVTEQRDADYDAISRRAAESKCSVALILDGGEVRGILPVAGSRGAFDQGVVQLAGKYATLPEAGLLSPRRARAKKKAAKPAPPATDRPGTKR